MPDKKNESKILSMLEKTGFVRKNEGDGESANANSASGLNDSEIKPIFDAPKSNNSPAAPVAPQPAKAATQATRPERTTITIDPQSHARSESASVGEKPAAPVYDTVSLEREYNKAVATEPSPAEASPVREAPATEKPFVVEAPVSSDQATSQFDDPNRFRGDYVADELSVMSQIAAGEKEKQPENYTDRFLNTDELYEALALKSKKTDSIYLIEEYLKTLPDSLPNTSRREIVNKLLAASEFDYDLLMGDGVLRVKMLKEYAERFAQHTDEYIANHQQQLEELNQQIIRTQQLIESRKELHKKQFFSIEAEAQRLKEILTFISG